MAFSIAVVVKRKIWEPCCLRLSYNTDPLPMCSIMYHFSRYTIRNHSILIRIYIRQSAVIIFCTSKNMNYTNGRKLFFKKQNENHPKVNVTSKAVEWMKAFCRSKIEVIFVFSLFSIFPSPRSKFYGHINICH